MLPETTRPMRTDTKLAECFVTDRNGQYGYVVYVYHETGNITEYLVLGNEHLVNMNGLSITEVIDYVIQNGWQTIFPQHYKDVRS